jgi:hypothetical protein
VSHRGPKRARRFVAATTLILLGSTARPVTANASVTNTGVANSSVANSETEPTHRASQQTDSAASANSMWLTDMYVETLGRPADDVGIDFWLSRLAGGGAAAREIVTKSFVYSSERSAVEVTRAYSDLLSRAPDAEGGAFWTDYLRTHPVTVLRANLIASAEYYNVTVSADPATSDRDWLDRLYLEVLERPADPTGRTYWASRLADGASRWQVVAAVYLSDESLGNRADSYAREILGRPLTPTEGAVAIALIKAEDERALRAQLLASDEAFEPYLAAIGLLEVDR